MSKLEFLIHFFVLQASCSECFNKSAAFQCTNNNGGYLIWFIETPRSDNLGVTMSYNIHPEGTTLVRQVGASTMIFYVISVNQTYMSVLLNISNPVSINGTTITCNTNSIRLLVRGANIPPSFLNVSLDKPNGIINVDWMPARSCYYVHFNGSIEIVNNGSYTLPLVNTTLEISFSSSLENELVSNFTIGSCFLMDSHTFKRHYMLYSNEVWTIFLECSDSNLQFDTTCNSTGIWSNKLNCPVHTTKVPDVSTSGIKMMNCTPQPCIENKDSAQVSQSFWIAIVITTAIASFVTALLIGISLGLIYGIKCTQKNMTKNNLNLSSQPLEVIERPIKAPEYEEVKLKEKSTNIQLLHNVAYAQVEKNID